jgi:hypothetical protein
VATALTLVAPAPVVAQGDLLIAPTRLVLDGRGGGEVMLSNIGEDEATYRIDLELRRMTREGNLVPIAEADANLTEKAALEMIRYAPRRVVLPAGEPQAIRISARPAPELPDGEYRVHMSFAAIPKVQAISAVEAGPETGFAINLIPVYGITMPIIVRKGALEVIGGLANPQIAQGPDGPMLLLDITRSGTASLFGDLLVYRQGADEPTFVARGVGVYPEIDARHSTFGLLPEQAEALRGAVRIEFRESILTGGRLISQLDTVLR